MRVVEAKRERHRHRDRDGDKEYCRWRVKYFSREREQWYTEGSVLTSMFLSRPPRTTLLPFIRAP